MGDISRYKGGACKKMQTGGVVRATPNRRGSGRSRLQNSEIKAAGAAVKQRKMAVGGQVQAMPQVLPGAPRPGRPMQGPGMAGIAAMPMPAAQPPSMPMQQMKRGGKVKGGC